MMNLRWLWFDYLNPELSLSKRQRREVQRRVSRGVRKFRVGLNPLEIAYTFVPLLIMAVPIALMQLKIVTPQSLMNLTTFALPFMAAAWISGTWIRRKARQRFVNGALRSMGFDICIKCGYWLRELGDDVKHCPECGATRESMSGRMSS